MDAPVQFGRYKVRSTLGQGEMGTVYLAEDPVIGRQVAIKTLRRQPAGAERSDGDVRGRFEREIRAAGMLVHPNIVAVLDVGIEAEETFIAMAYIDGGSLESLLVSRRTLAFDRVIGLASQIASGLDHAHEHGIVHRDIKPANILLTVEGAPMVSDFGIARVADSTLTRQGATCGSPAYMSPEQAAAQEVTGASDQFSLAIIIYRMLTGEVPFAGESVPTVVYRILRHEPVPPELINPLIPEAASEVLIRALSKLPSARYPSCTAFVEALAGALGTSVENLASSSSSTQLAATLVVDTAPLGESRNAEDARSLPPLWAAITSGLASGNRWLRSREGLELLSGWASLASRFARANRRPLLMAAGVVVVLATGMWLGTQLRRGDSTGEAEPSERMNESAVATLPSDIPGRFPAASEPTEAESEAAAPLPRAGSQEPAPVTQERDADPAGATDQEPAAAETPEIDTDPAGATDREPAAAETPEIDTDPAGGTDLETAAAVPQVADEAPDPVLESRWTAVAEGTVPDKLVERAREATTVLDEIMSAPDQGIPSSLMARARCVAVIPNVKKAGLIFGSSYGRGLVSCRTEGGWSRPSFVSISGGSFGFQIGAQSTDVVLVFVSREAVDLLLGNQFTLGADGFVSAGPVGETADAGADATLRTGIYAYSRSRGAFAGASLEGADLGPDREANEDAYGGPLGPEELLFVRGGALPAELAVFVRNLERFGS